MFRYPFAFHRLAQTIGNSNAGRTSSEHNDLLILQTFSGHFDCAQYRSESNRRRSLDVVIEGQQFIAVAPENGPSMRGREIFPLQTCSGKFLLHGLNELIDEGKVRLTGNPFVAPPEVFGIVEPLLIVGPYIQHDGQCSFRTNSPMSVYKDSFPIGIPMPPAPWSPMPRMRSPSVTTITSTSGLGRFRRSAGIESRSG